MNQGGDEPSSCIFCRIASGEIPTRRVHEDDEIVAFEDTNPQAPTHTLIVPRVHIATINDLRGYRLVWNCLEEAGQSVFHIHLHLLGGRPFRWPPG
jgi:histidine triad (HIT) family protein